jgi:hypothetical protein
MPYREDLDAASQQIAALAQKLAEHQSQNNPSSELTEKEFTALAQKLLEEQHNRGYENVRCPNCLLHDWEKL